MADSHAQTTLRHHFRDDYSCYHVVSYDTLSGQPHFKGTHQGYATIRHGQRTGMGTVWLYHDVQGDRKDRIFGTGAESSFLY